MPTKKGRFAGFCFVQFKTYQEAASAMKEVNGGKIKERIVAVDWAIPKDQYMTAVIEEKRQKKNENQTTDSKDEEPVVAQDDDEASTSDGDNSDDESEQHTEDDEVSENRQKPSDVPEGKTVFIRGLPFETDEEELRQVFEKFGELHYAVICKFHDSNLSKGSGFVKFVDKSSVDTCLISQNAGDGISLKGRKLNICQAMERKDVSKIISSKKEDSEPKDKRNLHLLRVALIRAGTNEANNMSDQDATKRLRIEAANRQKIKNLNIFVSPMRLVVHNIPAHVNDKQLKIICLRAVKDKSAVIKECRIMRDRDRVNDLGVAKSRGYAFVEFELHNHAMECLKKLNNNPEIFTDGKRPVVEFSLENRLALNAKAARLEKSKLTQQKASGVNASEQTTKKRKVSFKPPVVAAPPNAPKNPFPSHMGPKIRTSTRRLKSRKTKTDAKQSQPKKLRDQRQRSSKKAK